MRPCQGNRLGTRLAPFLVTACMVAGCKSAGKELSGSPAPSTGRNLFAVSPKRQTVPAAPPGMKRTSKTDPFLPAAAESPIAPGK